MAAASSGPVIAEARELPLLPSPMTLLKIISVSNLAEPGPDALTQEGSLFPLEQLRPELH